MITSELKKIFFSKKSLLFLLLLLLIPLYDLYMNATMYPESLSEAMKIYGAGGILHPSEAAFLTGRSIGHLPQMAFVWILPVYCLSIYCDLFVVEKRSGFVEAVAARIGFSRYYVYKILFSFGFFFCITLVVLLINYGLACIVFNGGTDLGGMADNYLTRGVGDAFNIWEIQHPYITYLLFVLSFSVITGGCGALCTAISILIPDYKRLYPICIFAWLIQFMLSFFLGFQDITAAIQPFTEYNGTDFLAAHIIWLITILVAIFLVVVRRLHKDEI